MGGQIAVWLRENVEVTSDLRLAIEVPIFNRNVANFQLQMRLFQSIVEWVTCLFPDFSILEVNPKTVKRVFTGSGKADKEAMVANSWFAEADIQLVDKEALADAQAIAQCATLLPPVGELYRMHDKVDASDMNLTSSRVHHFDTEPGAENKPH